MENEKSPASFRDNSGFIFNKDNALYRQINKVYQKNYEHLFNSGLYKKLTDAQLLIPHEEVDNNLALTDKVFKVIKPKLVPFISYPYEWCFSQLKNAALFTLQIQKTAIEYEMSLKDASAYNIQFRDCKPILIDTLSFEKYCEGQPWFAYRQFCQHFLAPLALMSLKDIRLGQLFRVFIDGMPLDLTSELLPFSTYFKLSLLSHIHIHAKSQKHFANKSIKLKKYKMSRLSFLALIDSLESAIKSLKWQPKNTEWADYYNDTNYSKKGIQHKKQIISEFLDRIKPKFVLDLGANIGTFSRIAGEKNIQTISCDVDPAAVEKNYLECVEKDETNILPLLLDLTNPTPNIGWQNQERTSFFERCPNDTVLALALIHHIVISNNLPFDKLADFFSAICNSLIIEFVPKTDSQVQKLLSTREDIFTDYTQKKFEDEFGIYFAKEDFVKIADSERIVYLLKKK